MSKFQAGDRVKANHGFPVDGVQTVAWVLGQWIKVGDADNQQWHENRFELYAKAGEFVVGDYVVGIERACQMRPGDLCKVLEIFPATSAEKEDISVCRVRRLSDGDEFQFYFTRFRLATSEEIAAAEAKTVELTGAVSAEQAALFAVRIDANQAKNLGWDIFTPESGKTVFHHAGEIPAADFDFSTIKAGSSVLVRLTVERDGLDHDGDIVCEGYGPHGQRYFNPHQIVSVIPTPKPKTLRERAIEAALGGIPGVDPSDETKGVVLAGGQVISLHALVDLVLAEVEKG